MARNIKISNITKDIYRPYIFIGEAQFEENNQLVNTDVWYNVNTGRTGPGKVNPHIRNKLRFDVHNILKQEQQPFVIEY